ncbi:(2E,6E)-farnesyl diphosphate synthase [Aestuariicella sp. G3-2]|uniref:(2E,6E)-farnesyl diphosphate synthase n=1 Tax=Pseudomaricurvus albidus TaxID=2842452 RepID=UPI001C0DE1AD|nr:farnesyl diphosphate synthase [Aestuariicella albida]MBU3069104.1 (2E,6E)-farnesyl diphosphate synthase [Aestuariicella albida]
MTSSPNSPLAAFLQDSQTRIDRALDAALSQLTPNSEPDLINAMRYSLLNGGKRIRPVLVYASAIAVQGTITPATDQVACALECIHAYSLIHDDLPAMDDDDLRRGKPTCHIAFNEATAILAGDALQALAFQSLASAPLLDSDTRLQLVQQLAQAAGAQGMVGGQAIDLAAVNSALTLEQLQHMHNLKTGALISASILMGATATGRADPAQLASLKTYADAIGLAFQVQDDILDVTADTATLGKQQGADIALNKPTYVSLLGLEGAQRKALELHQQALAALNDFGEEADHLRDLSAYIVEREK